MAHSRSPKRHRRKRNSPAKATPEYLEQAALSYLARYSAPSVHVRRLLMAKVHRSARAHGTDPGAGASTVDSIITRLIGRRLIDDAAFAQGRAASLRRQGASRHSIHQHLAAKGVAVGLIAEVLAGPNVGGADADLAAALIYARRRRLGPYRRDRARMENRERDLAALGRQGFSYEITRRIVDTHELADLEAEAGLCC